MPVVVSTLRAESITELPVLGRFFANDPANRPGTVVPESLLPTEATDRSSRPRPCAGWRGCRSTLGDVCSGPRAPGTDVRRRPEPRRSDPSGLVELAPDVAAQADDRFEAVCAELGILLARHVEPVSARVLPFGSEQLAMVQLLDASTDGRAPARRDRPGHVARGGRRGCGDRRGDGWPRRARRPPCRAPSPRARSARAVVFRDGDAPVRWGGADDEARLAALYAVVPHLGSFTATTGADTYRVLRLPGIGVALVSEGPSAAAWVEGWFAALLHATQFALRVERPSTGVAPAAPPVAPTDPAEAHAARVLEALEAECRRILVAAEDQASEIRAAAARDAEGLAARWPGTDRPDETPRIERDDTSGTRLADARREADTILKEAERARAALLSDAQREVDLLRRDMERTCATLLADAKRECEAMTREAERLRTAMLADARREVDELRRDGDVRRPAPPAYVVHDEWRPDPRHSSDALVAEARRAAEDLLREARRTADDLVRDAARDRDRLFDEVRRTSELAREELHRAAWSRVEHGTPPGPAAPAATPAPVTDEAQSAALALLRAAADSIAVMNATLGAAGTTATAAPKEPAGEPADVERPRPGSKKHRKAEGLFFGA